MIVSGEVQRSAATRRPSSRHTRWIRLWLTRQPALRPAPAPAWTLECEGAKERPQLGFLFGGPGRGEAGGTRLADDATGPAFGDPEQLLEQRDRCPATVQKFPRFNSFSMSMSRAWLTGPRSLVHPLCEL